MNAIRDKYFMKLSRDFELMAELVLNQMSLVIALPEAPDSNEVSREIEKNELLIDSLEIKMRDRVINTIVLYNPKAGDLRKIIAWYDITAYMERIGDLVLNISRFLEETDLNGLIFSDFSEEIVKLMVTVKSMVQNAIFAFTCEDNLLARETIELDQVADTLHMNITERLRINTPGELNRQELTDVLNINSMSYNIERIGDNATNIAEAVIYLIEGKDIKHGLQEDMLLAGSEG